MTTTELVPVGNLAELDTLDPQAREVAVTRMLGEARSWLAHAVEATEPRAVADFKAFVATIAETTKQLNLSKEIQLDAVEMVRRAERGVGAAVQAGQARGEIAKSGQIGASPVSGVFGGGGASGVKRGEHLVRPVDAAQVSHRSEVSELYTMAAPTDEQFDAAIAEAKAEGNLSRANVVRKIKGDIAPRPTERPEMLRGTRRVDANRVIGSTVLDASSVVSPSLIEAIDFADLNRENLGEWISSLSESIRALQALKKSLEKELNHDRV